MEFRAVAGIGQLDVKNSFLGINTQANIVVSGKLFQRLTHLTQIGDIVLLVTRLSNADYQPVAFG